MQAAPVQSNTNIKTQRKRLVLELNKKKTKKKGNRPKINRRFRSRLLPLAAIIPRKGANVRLPQFFLKSFS